MFQFVAMEEPPTKQSSQLIAAENFPFPSSEKSVLIIWAWNMFMDYLLWIFLRSGHSIRVRIICHYNYTVVFVCRFEGQIQTALAFFRIRKSEKWNVNENVPRWVPI